MVLNISAGQVAIVLGLLAVFGKLWSIGRKIDRIVWEHDLMWEEYARSHNLKIRKANGATAGSAS